MAGTASASTDGGGNQEAAKKKKKLKAADWSTEERISARRAVRNCRKSWVGREAACARPIKARTGVNDKVWTLNKDTEKAFETRAILHERFEQVTQ